MENSKMKDSRMKYLVIDFSDGNDFLIGIIEWDEAVAKKIFEIMEFVKSNNLGISSACAYLGFDLWIEAASTLLPEDVANDFLDGDERFAIVEELEIKSEPSSYGYSQVKVGKDYFIFEYQGKHWDRPATSAVDLSMCRPEIRQLFASVK